MRVAIVTESFLPQVNGVTNSVLRVCEQLTARGHEALVVAPGPGPRSYADTPVVRTPSLPVPGYRSFRLGRPYAGMEQVLRSFEPDLVHLASPVMLGAQGGFAARRLGIPVVAVYQTDLAGFASRYHLGRAEESVWRWLRTVHATAERTLAPSWAAVRQLESNGVQHVRHWARGVDLRRFHPLRRDVRRRRELLQGEEVLVGYVGRLANEKELGLLEQVQDLPHVQLVVVGDGPARRQVERALPRARFLGFQGGDELAATFASLDLFVHPGSHETFCQAAQEALASGVPVVAARAGGLLDLVQDGVNGLTFEPGSTADVTAQVGRLVEDAVLRRRLRGASRSTVEGRSWDAIGHQLMRHYGEVLAA